MAAETEQPDANAGVPISSDDDAVVVISLLPNEPPFYSSLHAQYIAELAANLDQPTSYEGAVTDHLRMSGVYWSLTALSLLMPPDQVDATMGVTSCCAVSNTTDGTNTNNTNNTNKVIKRQAIVDWVFDCFDAKHGGFGGTPGHDAHILYTLSAIQVLALADSLQDERLLLQRAAIIEFCVSLQQPDGSFCGDKWGEIDTRFTYCALSTLSILQALNITQSTKQATVNVAAAADYILQCRNLDGGFGAVAGAESHAGQVFCCIGALSIAHALDKLNDVDDNLLAWWLAERQVDSGGLNGRPEKQADVCYSWWILSALSILGKREWINGDKLAGFILKCQDDQDGGIADRPDDMADVFHTFFGIAGLSLLGNLHSVKDKGDGYPQYRKIDPVYALPTDVVLRLGLKAQVLVTNKDEPVDERLAHYQVSYTDDDAAKSKVV